MTTTTTIQCSGTVANATLDTSNPAYAVLTITTNQEIQQLSSSNALLLYTNQGYIVPGPGQAWDATYFNQVAMGAYIPTATDSSPSGMCWALFDQWNPGVDVPVGTYKIKMAAPQYLSITAISVGNPGTPTTGSIEPHMSMLGTSGNGPLYFTVKDGPIILVNDSTNSNSIQPLLLTLKNAGCTTGSSHCWGGNIGALTIQDTPNSGYANSNSPNLESNYYQYLLYPDLNDVSVRTVVLTPGNYKTSITVQGGAQLLNLTTGSYTPPTSQPVTRDNPVYSGKLPLQVGYIQLSGEHPVDSTTMPAEGLASCNIVVLAFAGTDPNSFPPAYTSTPPRNPMNFYEECRYIGSLVPKDAQIFYSVGGANMTSASININTVDAIVNNVVRQAKALSDYFPQGITGIDLDMEGGWPNPVLAIDANTIAGLIDGFKGHGYKVSLAPQIVSTNGEDINSSNPCINLGLASGGAAHQYNDAIRLANNQPDYLFVQCYNTGKFTIDGKDETSIDIFTSAYTALNNLISTKYNEKTAPMSIIKAQKAEIAIGFPANGGSGNVDTIYQPTLMFGAPTTDYHQLNVLGDLKAKIDSEKWDNNVKGIMVWSLNNDYMPKWFQDNYAVTGGFCQNIFGAGQVLHQQPGVPYMTLQLQIGAPENLIAGFGVTIITPHKEYLVFGTPNGNGGTQPMVTSDKPALWTTITPISDGDVTRQVASMFNVAENGSLDVIASHATPAGYACHMIVDVWGTVPNNSNEVVKDPTIATLMQSQQMPITLYANADNVITVAIYNTDNNELPPFSDDFEPKKNGKFILSVRNKQDSGSQQPVTTGAEFWWSNNVPDIGPAWLGSILNVAFDIALDAGLSEIGGEMLPILFKFAEAGTGVDIKFTQPGSSSD